MTKNVTIHNSGEKFTALKVVKIDKEGKRVFGDKIEVPAGAIQVDELTAEYICKVFADRCSVVAVLGKGEEENLLTRIAELEYALEGAIKLIKDKKEQERLTKVLKGEAFEETVKASTEEKAPETTEEAEEANKIAEEVKG